MPDGHRSAVDTNAKVERARRDEQMLLGSVLENLPLGVGVYDAAGKLLHSNASMRDYAGVSRLPSQEPDIFRRWRGYGPDGRPIMPADYPGARALRGETVSPGVETKPALRLIFESA